MLSKARHIAACVVLVACGGAPAEPIAEREPVAEPAVEAPAQPTPMERVCAAELCGGPGTAVRTWSDATGEVARYEIISSPGCSHIAGIFFDAQGESQVVLPMPFYPPGTSDEQASITRLHDAQLTGLTPTAQTTCP